MDGSGMVAKMAWRSAPPLLWVALAARPALAGERSLSESGGRALDAGRCESFIPSSAWDKLGIYLPEDIISALLDPHLEQHASLDQIDHI